MRFVFLLLPDYSVAGHRVLFLEISINVLLPDSILTFKVVGFLVLGFFFAVHVKISLFPEKALVVFKYL